VHTFTKSGKKPHYIVQNDLSGTARLAIATINMTTLGIDYHERFMLKIRQHRAIDMDATKKVLIVVEEAASSFQSRSVHMYRPSMYITTYRPPTVHFQPSDVSFHHMNGQELLLISDEANHAIHVVKSRKIN
jgi:hypothetical protein